MLKSFLLFALCIVARTQGQNWNGCVNPDTLQKELITIGERHTVCFTIGSTLQPGGDWAAGANYLRYTFQPEADQYSRFRIPDSYTDLVVNLSTELSGNMTVHTAAQDMLSFLRVYYDSDSGRIFPFLTAIIDVKDGVVQGIAWDDACVFCNKRRCLENMFDFDGISAAERGITQPSRGCYLEAETCSKKPSDCDLQLYVVWTGTDTKGNVFQSSASRFSAFPEQRLQDRVFNIVPELGLGPL